MTLQQSPIARLTLLPYLPSRKRADLPSITGLYFVVQHGGVVLYIGKTRNLLQRWRNHHRAAQLIAADTWIVWYAMPSQIGDQSLTAAERAAIRTFAPRLNDTPIERKPITDTRPFHHRYRQRWAVVDQQIVACRTTVEQLTHTERLIDRELIAAHRWLRAYQRQLHEVLARRQDQHAATRTALLSIRQQCLDVLPRTQRQAV